MGAKTTNNLKQDWIYKIAVGSLSALSAILLMVVLVFTVYFYRSNKKKRVASKDTESNKTPQFWVPMARYSSTGVPTAARQSISSGGRIYQTKSQSIQPAWKNKRSSVPALGCVVPLQTQVNVQKSEMECINQVTQEETEDTDAGADSSTNFLKAPANLMMRARHSISDVSNLLRQSEQEETDVDIEATPYVSRVQRLSSFNVLRTEELSSDMYSGNECDYYYQATNSYGLGLLCFSLHFDQDAALLTVILHKAMYLTSKRAKEKGHFYVKLRLHERELKSAASCASLDTITADNVDKHNRHHCPSNQFPEQHTEIKSAFRNVEFESRFEFKVTKEKIKERVLQMIVKESMGVMEKNGLLGVVNFHLAEAEFTEDQESLVEVWRDIVNPESDALSRGEILLSLRYETNVGLLQVGVVRARDLSVKPHAMGSVYAKVSLMSGENVIKTKESKHVKKDLVNPEFPTEEVINFKLDPCLLNSVSCVVFLCYNKTKLAHMHLLGKCVIGPINYSDGDGLEHWTNMVVNCGNTVEKWHNLI